MHHAKQSMGLHADLFGSDLDNLEPGNWIFFAKSYWKLILGRDATRRDATRRDATRRVAYCQTLGPRAGRAGAGASASANAGLHGGVNAGHTMRDACGPHIMCGTHANVRTDR